MIVLVEYNTILYLMHAKLKDGALIFVGF